MLRFRVLFVSAALCLSAAALAACGSGEDTGQAEGPRQVLDAATFEGVESADFDGSLGIESKGPQGGDVEIDLSGRAQSEGIDVTTTVAGTAGGKPVDFEGGLTLLADHGFVNYQGTEYEIDPSNYSFAKALFFPLAEEGDAEIAACKQAASEIQPADLVDGLQNDGTADVAGTETTRVSGKLNVPVAIDAIVGLAENPGCNVQVEALSPFPMYRIRRIGDELATSVEKSKVEIYVGDDGIIRKLSAEFTADPSGSREPVTVDLELTLSELNANRKIEAPAGAKHFLFLFTKLGINRLEFLTWSDGGEGVRALAEKVAADAFPSVAP